MPTSAPSAARARARSRTRSSRRSISPPAGCCSSGTASITSPSRSPTRRWKRDWDFFHINSVDLDGDGNLLISSRSTHTIYKLDRSGADPLAPRAASAATSPSAPARSFAWQHDARRQPDGTLTRLRQRRHPGGGDALARADPRRRRAGDDRHPAAPVHPPEDPLRQPGQRCSCWPNGNVFVGWGEVPHVSEFHRSGRLLFDAMLGDEVPVLPRLPPALDGPARRSAGDRPWALTASSDRLRELERSDRRTQLAAARRRTGRRDASGREHALARVRERAASKRRTRSVPRGPGARRRRDAARAIAHGHGLDRG